MDELLFFSPEESEFTEDSLEDILNHQSLILLFKIHATSSVEDIDDALLTIVYGNLKKPPGTPESVYALLCDTIEDENTGEIKNLEGQV